MTKNKWEIFNVTQGNYVVTKNPNAVLRTVLGSCVCVCVHDSVLKFGGMNHFLLAADSEGPGAENAKLYGAYLIELLLNEMYAQGSVKKNFRVKLFGGAQSISSTLDPGEKNSNCIQKYFANENIHVSSASLRGNLGRVVEFFPVSGQARQKFLQKIEPTLIPAPQRTQQQTLNEVELFLMEKRKFSGITTTRIQFSNQ